jgi:DNA helicase-2/ATP-dependent DNA helicase PcrA
MGEFMRDLGIAAPIKLTQNYRSLSTILDAANAVIAQNQNRLGKDLWTTAGRGEPIRHFQAMDDGEEARFVVEQVQGLHGEGLAYQQMAVLYRANAQSRAIEHALFTAGVPYRVYGGQRFFERAEIKHALAYLRLVANPDDDNAFLRVVNFPARGIGTRSIEAIEADARLGGVSLWAAACKGGKKFTPFVQLIEALRAETEPLSLAEAAEVVVQRSGLIEHYKKEKDGEDRIDNLNELANAAAAFSQENEDHSLVAFLAHAALEAGEHEAGASQDAVQLMTVHAAKGLEFHTVFITGLEEGLFPHDNAMNELDGLEEERRLMYVAITRARRQLYLSHSQYRLLHGQPRYGLPSRFLDEIPEGLLQSLRPYRSSAPVSTRSSGYAAALPAVAGAPPASAALPFKVGARVRHVRYGEGVVGGYQGQGAETEIRITFPGVGDKWFILEYARLTPC